ncbi:mitochondrial 2-oxodicarboxylate carrier [Drosophila kikkawai]|uniref:Mitochondrial 2-oxodicarboxylate carrier n=1 Tax=Drosophila kikkawai TaxID=30033 RepID=A0A6P4IXE1_DROKI|nr:mitochondrial 2-oxodicarboxylate carrier [Drosophila kikkawai]
MASAHTELPPRRRASIQFLAGMAVGMLEVVLLSPLDLVKSRLQVQGIDRVPSRVTYSGVRDAFVKIYRHEGLTAFWRGIVPPLFIDPPKRGIKFLTISLFKPLVQFGPQPTSMTYAIAGALSGTVEAFLMNPFEVVKITQQVHQAKRLKTLAMAKHIIRRNGYGMKGLYRGITAFIARNVVFQFTYFGVYANIKSRAPVVQHSTSELLLRFAIASFSGAMGCTLSVPLDLAKCRIQAPQPVRGVIKYGWTVQTLRTIYREEGIRAMYKGLTPLLMRAIPSGAIQMVSYEAISDALTRSFSDK